MLDVEVVGVHVLELRVGLGVLQEAEEDLILLLLIIIAIILIITIIRGPYRTSRASGPGTS